MLNWLDDNSTWLVYALAGGFCLITLLVMPKLAKPDKSDKELS